MLQKWRIYHEQQVSLLLGHLHKKRLTKVGVWYKPSATFEGDGQKL